MEDFLIKSMALGTLVIDASIIAFIISSLFKSLGFYTRIFTKYGLLVVFLLSLASTFGSLILSIGLDLPPCDLCWYQRIFMYPIVFISGYALLKKDYKSGSFYSFILAIVGAILALYHFLTQQSKRLNENDFVCAIGELSSDYVDCGVPYFIEFGFVSIPFMSLSVFVLIIILAIYGQRKT